MEICVLAKIEMAPLILSNVLVLESDRGDTKFHEETCNLKVSSTTMISSFGTTYKALKRKKKCRKATITYSETIDIHFFKLHYCEILQVISTNQFAK